MGQVYLDPIKQDIVSGGLGVDSGKSIDRHDTLNPMNSMMLDGNDAEWAKHVAQHLETSHMTSLFELKPSED